VRALWEANKSGIFDHLPEHLKEHPLPVCLVCSMACPCKVQPTLCIHLDGASSRTQTQIGCWSPSPPPCVISRCARASTCARPWTRGSATSTRGQAGSGTSRGPVCPSWHRYVSASRLVTIINVVQAEVTCVYARASACVVQLHEETEPIPPEYITQVR
jgi:hypothetical protein